MDSDVPPYLAPYQRAVKRYGAEFEALCWTSLIEQTARFKAMIEVYDFASKRMIDAGCGRADFYDYLTACGIIPGDYLGIEAILPLADGAKRKTGANYSILTEDFLVSGFPPDFHPDVIVFSGSLNTFKVESLQRALRSAIEAARDSVVFNCLCTPDKAGAPWLAWHSEKEIRSLIEPCSCEISFHHGYLDGDVTVVAKRTRSSIAT
jgi:hypothetical protein